MTIYITLSSIVIGVVYLKNMFHLIKLEHKINILVLPHHQGL